MQTEGKIQKGLKSSGRQIVPKKLDTGKSKAKKSTRNSEDGTPMTPMVRSSRIPDDSGGNQIALYEPQSEILMREVLDSTSLINESTKLLHGQTKSLLKVQDESVRKVDHYNMEQARSNMNTLAKLIQVKVNLFKVAKQK